MTEVKVSVIMPSLNVGKYIAQCIESVINQTLKEIEIICVDAGSTDGTLEILQEYANKDNRITILHSDIKSYGYQMNLGLKAAKGEYIGIVETDDYADLDMFQKLYETAIKDDLDVVKSGFYFYYSVPEETNTPVCITSKVLANRILCPATDFEVPLEMAEFYNIKPTIWSAIYKSSFLTKEDIWFNETKGASYQDASFNFKVFACAKRVRLVKECYLHYRQDNENSSINSSGKIYCICDEYDEMERFLSKRPELAARLEMVKSRLKYDSYMWNYERLSPESALEFIQHASKDLQKDMLSGYMHPDYFQEYKWNTLLQIIETPLEFHENKQLEMSGQVVKSKKDLKWLKKKIKGFKWLIDTYGVGYALGRLRRKFDK